jgi:hypothetical protein
MQRNRLFLILGAVGAVFLVACMAAIVLGSRGLRAQPETPTPAVVAELSLCDTNSYGLCVVSFGADALNRMVINFKLPRRRFTPFYALVAHAGATTRYECQVVPDVPTSTYCTGPRTPLGDPIDIEVHAASDDRLLAEGSFVVAAIALPTPGSVLVIPTETVGTPPTSAPLETPGTPGTPGTPQRRHTPTPTPPIGYYGR